MKIFMNVGSMNRMGEDENTLQVLDHCWKNRKELPVDNRTDDDDKRGRARCKQHEGVNGRHGVEGDYGQRIASCARNMVNRRSEP